MEIFPQLTLLHGNGYKVLAQEMMLKKRGC